MNSAVAAQLCPLKCCWDPPIGDF